jgi:hypothetical protein
LPPERDYLTLRPHWAFTLRPAQQLRRLPSQTAKALVGIRMAHKDALELAQHAVDQSQQLAGVRPENLPAITLAVLARFGAHLRQYQPKRPQ